MGQTRRRNGQTEPDHQKDGLVLDWLDTRTHLPARSQTPLHPKRLRRKAQIRMIEEEVALLLDSCLDEILKLKMRVTALESELKHRDDNDVKNGDHLDQRLAKIVGQIEKLQGVHGR